MDSNDFIVIRNDYEQRKMTEARRELERGLEKAQDRSLDLVDRYAILVSAMTRAKVVL